MKIVYIAGPYTGKSYKEIDNNIANARKWAVKLAEYEIGFFCPHLNSAHFEEHAPGVPESFWKELDIKLLKACDAVLVIEGWERSKGAQTEALEATRLELPIFNTLSFESFIEWAHG